jgi:hypothetical protein
MTTVNIYPQESFFCAFIATRHINISDNKADVLHYFEKDLKKLKKLVHEVDPDLTVIHNKNHGIDLGKLNFPFVYDPVKDDKGIYRHRKIITNAYDLTKLYYGKLGLSREVITLEKEKKEKGAFAPNVNKIKSFMMWE